MPRDKRSRDNNDDNYHHGRQQTLCPCCNRYFHRETVRRHLLQHGQRCLEQDVEDDEAEDLLLVAGVVEEDDVVPEEEDEVVPGEEYTPQPNWVSEAAKRLKRNPRCVGGPLGPAIPWMLTTIQARFKLTRACMEVFTAVINSRNDGSNINFRSIEDVTRGIPRRELRIEMLCKHGCVSFSAKSVNGADCCPACGSRIDAPGTMKYFRLPVIRQFETLVQREDLKEYFSVVNIAKRDPDDGLYISPGWKQKVQAYASVCTQNNIVLSVSAGVDGVEILQRGFWLQVLIVDNLPRSLRYRRENLIVIGIALRKPPSGSGLLHTFCEEIADFHPTKRGHKWGQQPTPFLLFVVLLLIKADLPALTLLLNLKGHTSSYGCVKCLLPTPRVFGKSAFRRFHEFGRNIRAYRRTLEEFKFFSDLAKVLINIDDNANLLTIIKILINVDDDTNLLIVTITN